MKLFDHVVYNNLFDGVLIYEAQTLYTGPIQIQH
jgi:hypothetical protein